MTTPLGSNIRTDGVNQGDLVTFLQNVRDNVNAISAAVSGILGDGLLAHGGLEIDGSTASDFATSAIAVYRIGGVAYQKAATTGISFTAAHVVTLETFGIILIQIDAAGAISTVVPAATPTTAMEFASAALAIAALPAADEGNVALGYIVIEADTGDWTANTDDLTDAGDLTSATFVDATPVTTTLSITDLTLNKG
jgi:hypothetical protein